MAALLLGRMLTRPDMGPALVEFLDWTNGALATTDGLKAPFIVPGTPACMLMRLHLFDPAVA